MRVLIVDDSAFNAFCLTRLLQTVCHNVQISVVNDSISALHALENETPSLIILDGDLGASDGLACNGPALADAIWQINPSIPLIAWSDSETQRHAFSEIFRQHKKFFNELHCWPKVVSQERISSSLKALSSQIANLDGVSKRKTDVAYA